MKTNRLTSAQRSFARHSKLLSRSAEVVRIFLTTVLGLVGVISASATEPSNTLIPTTVEVPLARRYFPFEHDRVLMVPPGFNISVVAQIPLARFIMPFSTGEILVAQHPVEAFYSSGLKPTERRPFRP